MRDNAKSGALTEVTFYILLSLYTPKHGYAVMQFVEEKTGGRLSLGAGTLYGALNSLQDKKWIEPYGETEVSPENPVKELKGFCKLSLAPGETKYAEFELTADAFRHFDEKTDAWKVIAGSYTIYIGSSVSDIRSVTTITIK